MILAPFPTLNYAGRVNCVTGYGGAARHQILALRSHGLRLRIVDTGSAGDPDPSHQSPFVQACRKSDEGQPKASIIHMGPNMTADWRRRLPGPHILVSVWETTRLPAQWVPLCNGFDQVWCATEWQANVYRESGVDAGRVKYVPFALDPDHYPTVGPVCPEVDALRREGYFVFGSMFQWTERKAPRALIAGFLSAFQRGERVALVLKSYEGDDPGKKVEAHVKAICDSYIGGHRPRVVVLSRRMTHDDTLAFYRGIDCYVSAHRGEGFNLSMAESMLLGRPVIATDWSAPAEYAAGLFHPVAYTLEPPHSMHPWQPFYTIDQEWAAPDVSSLAGWMRLVHDQSAGAPPIETVRARFRGLMQTAGEQAAAALRELL